MKMTDQIKNRWTGAIMCAGLTLEVVIENHRKWLYDEEGGQRANLSAADLRAADLRAADLSDADLSYADLRAADLSYANLRAADLRAADLSDADLSYADLSYAPFKIKNIHRKVYEAASQPCALDMSSWHHLCGTTHCRAGWVVTLAGDAGKALEWAYGTPAAAAMIYLASDQKIGKMPNFYCDNETALADMKLRAEKEAKNAAA